MQNTTEYTVQDIQRSSENDIEADFIFILTKDSPRGMPSPLDNQINVTVPYGEMRILCSMIEGITL